MKSVNSYLSTRLSWKFNYTLPCRNQKYKIVWVKIRIRNQWIYLGMKNMNMLDNIWHLYVVIYIRLLNHNLWIYQDCRKFLAKQLTISQPGGQILPTTVLRSPKDFQTLWRSWIILRLEVSHTRLSTSWCYHFYKYDVLSGRITWGDSNYLSRTRYNPFLTLGTYFFFRIEPAKV